MANKLVVSRDNFNTLVNDNAALSGAAFTGDVSVAGNLTVSGTTSTVINLDISDNLIGLNNGLTTGAESINDAGIIIARGNTGDNAFMGWDESEDKFIVGLTTATASSLGDLTITTGTLVANLEGDFSGNAATATKIDSITNTDIVLLGATQELTNKTLVAPVLGTPASGDLSNCTLPAAAILQGTMASGMTLVAPNLGTPSFGDLSNCVGLPAAAILQGTMASGMTLVEPTLTDAKGVTSIKTASTTYASGNDIRSGAITVPAGSLITNIAVIVTDTLTHGSGDTTVKVGTEPDSVDLAASTTFQSTTVNTAIGIGCAVDAKMTTALYGAAPLVIVQGQAYRPSDTNVHITVKGNNDQIGGTVQFIVEYINF